MSTPGDPDDAAVPSQTSVTSKRAAASRPRAPEHALPDVHLLDYVRVLYKRRWTATTVFLIVLLATAVAGLFVPPALGRLVDVVNDGGAASQLTGPLVVLLVATLVQGLLRGTGQSLVVRVGEAALSRLREKVLDRALAHPATAPLGRFLDRHVPRDLRRNPDRLEQAA